MALTSIKNNWYADGNDFEYCYNESDNGVSVYDQRGDYVGYYFNETCHNFKDWHSLNETTIYFLKLHCSAIIARRNI